MRTVIHTLWIIGIAAMVAMFVYVQASLRRGYDSVDFFLPSLTVIVLSVICFSLAMFFTKIGQFIEHYGEMLDGLRPVSWEINSEGRANMQMEFDPVWAKAYVQRKYDEDFK